MVLLSFLLAAGIFLVFAFFAGNVFHFLNLDSLIISPLAVVFFSLGTFKGKELLRGFRSMFMFSLKKHRPDRAVAAHYKALALVSVAAGVVSTIQGFISYSLSLRDLNGITPPLPVGEAFSYALFSTAYGILYGVFLFYPVFLLHREPGHTIQPGGE